MEDKAILYCSKTKLVAIVSSTKVEFFTAITASKVVLFLSFVSEDLNLPMAKTTHIYEDNKSCIKIVNAYKSTDRVKHLEVTYF